MAAKLLNVAKPDVQTVQAFKACLESMGTARMLKLFMRTRAVAVNLWTGKLSLSESIVTVEPSEKINERL